MGAHGLVTIMHVDVEGSTALTTRVGDEAAQMVLRETKRVVRAGAGAHGGREIDAVGDAMMLTFSSTRAAIAGATAVQSELAVRERERPDETLRVRIGLNVGEVLEREGTPFGAAVNAGARVMAKADGGEILVSEMVRQLAGTLPGIQYRDRGSHAFKGFDEPWRLYEVVWPGAPPKRPKPRARPSRGRLALAAAVLLVLVAAAVAVFAATRGSGSGLSAIQPNYVGIIDPATNRIVAEVPVGIRPGPIAFDRKGGSMYVGNLGDRNLTRIDERTRTVAGTIPLDRRTPTAIAVGSGGVWVVHGARGQLSFVDRQFNRVVTIDTIQAAPNVNRGGVAVGEDAVWAAYADSSLVQVDQDAIRDRRQAFVLGAAPVGIVVGDGALWVADAVSANVERFNPETFEEGAVRTIPVCEQPAAIAYGEGAVWVACEGDDTVTRISPATYSTKQTSVGNGPTAVAVGAGAVWVANTASGTVSRIDKVTYKVVQEIPVGAAPTGIAVANGLVWVTARAT